LTDLVKVHLKQLAKDWPKETLELIYKFQMKDLPSKEFDLCDVIIDLNSCWPEIEPENKENEMLFQRVAYFIFKNAFSKLKYLNSELVRQVIDCDDISAFVREKRTDTDTTVERTIMSLPWSDNDSFESQTIHPNSWEVDVAYISKNLNL
jgi:hypothetical protein